MSKVDAKVVLLGASGVGKTCLVQRYVNGNYSDQNAATVGSAYFVKKEIVRNKVISLGIWDTAGAERFESMTKIYYRGSSACIICWDLTKENSFGRVRYWVDEILSNVSDCRIYLVGTKADLITDNSKRAVKQEDVNTFAKSINAAAVIETSSKTGVMVDELFQQIAQNWTADLKDTDSDGVEISFFSTENKGCSC